MIPELSPFTSLTMEWTAVALNIGFTILIALHWRTGWLLGLVAALIGVVLYIAQDAWLMAALNGFYAFMGAFGWWSWGRKSGDGRIIRYRWQQHAFFLLIGAGATVLLSWAMAHWQLPGDHHGMEAFITAFAILATWMMSQRALENWIYWTIGDAVAVLYNHWIGYDGYALLNVVYIALAIVGLVRWSRKLRSQNVRSATAKQ